MVKTENQCVDCVLPCMGDTCPYRNVRVLYCDNCGNEVDKLYLYEGEETCEDCLFKLLPVIE